MHSRSLSPYEHAGGSAPGNRGLSNPGFQIGAKMAGESGTIP